MAARTSRKYKSVSWIKAIEKHVAWREVRPCPNALKKKDF
jgi:hypothetical protein